MSGYSNEHNPSAEGLEVLYRDEHLIAINKPSGLLVHRGWANDRITALSLVRSLAGQRVYPVHRLDRGTSGVLLFALSPEVVKVAQAQLEKMKMVKTYVTLVRGITPGAGEIDHPIAKEKGKPKQPARTSYRRLGTFERYSLVEAIPHTGRTHQLRRHFKHISHHIIGDVNYGKGDHNRLFRERFGLHRLALHALSLELPHPTTEERLLLRAGLPPDLAGPLEAMGLLGCVDPLP